MAQWDRKKNEAAGRDITFKANKKRFAELILAGSTRKIQLHEMLKYNSGALPLAISSIHGTIVKTNKANIFHHIKSLVEDPLPEDGRVSILDGMAIIQLLKLCEVASFGELAHYIC